MRWIAVGAGAAFVALAFAAMSRVSDTREGLIAEVVTLFAAMAGLGLLVYGLAARRRPGSPQPPAPQPQRETAIRPRATRDLVLGAGGIGLALVLVTGLALSSGLFWAAFGLAILLPMITGSVYLCLRFLRASP
jgi:hypothetical protein